MSPLVNNEDAPKSRFSFGLDFGGSVVLFGYAFDFCFDLFEWHFRATELYPVGLSLWVGPFYAGVTDATTRQLDPPTEKDLELIRLQKAAQDAEYKRSFAEDEAEQLRVQLAGCSVAAQGYGEKLDKGAYGWSVSYDDTRLLYIKYRQALNLIEKLRPKQAPKRSHKAKPKKTK